MKLILADKRLDVRQLFSKRNNIVRRTVIIFLRRENLYHLPFQPLTARIFDLVDVLRKIKIITIASPFHSAVVRNSPILYLVPFQGFFRNPRFAVNAVSIYRDFFTEFNKAVRRQQKHSQHPHRQKDNPDNIFRKRSALHEKNSINILIPDTDIAIKPIPNPKKYFSSFKII